MNGRDRGLMAATASFEAIGVTNTVAVADPRALAEALRIAERELAALDAACSRFRADSELSRLNEQGRARVSPLLREAIEVALDAARRSGGLVDPTVGGALRALGYDRDFALVVRRAAARRLELVPASGWRSVVVDGDLVRLRPGTKLDLGATAKAFAADRIAAAVHVATGVAALVSLGGDIAVAGPPPAEGWPVLVTDDHRKAGGGGQTVAVRDGGLATSSTTVRRWRAGAVELHHIVDPATGAPVAETWRTVTVAAATCVDANTAATAAIVQGGAAPAWLESLGLAARLVRPGGEVVRTGGWPLTAASQRSPAR
jgi:thiamine biosynthesis lipoprotein